MAGADFIDVTVTVDTLASLYADVDQYWESNHKYQRRIDVCRLIQGGLPVDPSINSRNREQTERLKAMQSWSDEALARRVGEHWTVGVALAHIAYWDSRTLAVLELAARYNLPRAWWTPAEAGAVNDARLPTWLAIPPREALHQAIQTAEILDRVISELPTQVVEAVMIERARSFDRFRHRGDHLDEVDRAVTD